MSNSLAEKYGSKMHEKAKEKARNSMVLIRASEFDPVVIEKMLQLDYSEGFIAGGFTVLHQFAEADQAKEKKGADA